ncbi:MAG: alpha/beta hydrolase [Cyanobacteria bacterium J06642_2]
MKLRNYQITKRGSSIQLVVAMHRWMTSSDDLNSVRRCVEFKLPDADILFPSYPAGPFSNCDPFQIAEELAQCISDANEKHRCGYKKIILIGHSLGALIVRKTFLLATGFSDDGDRPIIIGKQDWADKVTKIILLAGTNRGWSFAKKARNLSRSKWLLYKFVAWNWKLFRTARLINAARRGAPFVANTAFLGLVWHALDWFIGYLAFVVVLQQARKRYIRIQWIKMAQSPDAKLPPVVHLIGSRDDIIVEEDNVDVECDINYKYLRVQGAGHLNIVRFDKNPVFKRRFEYALTQPSESLKPNSYARTLTTDTRIQRVIFVVHGIRDYGFWCNNVEQKLYEIADKKSIFVITSSYGYFSMLGFLLQPERQENVRWFMDQYTEAFARFPKATFSFIGHSNGTYLLGSALRRYGTTQFENAVLAGSVLPRSYDWNRIFENNRLCAIRSYVATNDWIVGVFPGFFELLGSKELGAAGHNGFQDSIVRSSEIRFIRGGHGAAMVEENYDAMAQFALGNIASPVSAELLEMERSGIVVLIAKLSWVVWLLLLSLIGITLYSAYVVSWYFAIFLALFLYGIVRTI